MLLGIAGDYSMISRVDLNAKMSSPNEWKNGLQPKMTGVNNRERKPKVVVEFIFLPEERRGRWFERMVIAPGDAKDGG